MCDEAANTDDHLEEDDVMCPKEGSHSKKKARSRKRGEAADTPLPEAHQQLMDLFVAVDHAYCFLLKNSIAPTVSNLQSMIWRLFPGRFGDENSFLPRLESIAEFAHPVVVLEESDAEKNVYAGYEPEDTGVDHSEARKLELRFPLKSTTGVGKAKVAKRQQLVRRALAEHAHGGNGVRGGERGTAQVAGAPSDLQGCSGVQSPVAKRVTTKGRRAVAGEDSVDNAAVGVMVGNTNRGTPLESTRRRGLRNTNDAPKDGNQAPSDPPWAVGEKATVSSPTKGQFTGEAETISKPSNSKSTKKRSGTELGLKSTQATGTAISLFAPLSDSPAYVACSGTTSTVAAADGAPKKQVSGEVSDSAGGGSRWTARGVDAGSGKACGEERQPAPQQRFKFDPTRALDHLKSLPMYEGQAVYAETLPGREGEFADTRVPIHPEIKAALLGSKGVTRLFKHQALAIDAAMSGQHVALSTATSSGKSVVFNVSVVEAIVGARPEAVAMYLFPTKALAQDQLRSLKELVNSSAFLRERIRPMTLDGDTPFRERGEVAEEANIILTNPDMLHASVLPGHKRFRRILANLSYVVIDEAHVYRGAFGAHVSMVFRRLLRMWAMYASPGPPPQFICCSATMYDPPAHFASLLPLEECLGGRSKLYFESNDTAPAGRKTFVLWNPPIVADWFNMPEWRRKSMSVDKEGVAKRAEQRESPSNGSRDPQQKSDRTLHGAGRLPSPEIVTCEGAVSSNPCEGISAGEFAGASSSSFLSPARSPVEGVGGGEGVAPSTPSTETTAVTIGSADSMSDGVRKSTSRSASRSSRGRKRRASSRSTKLRLAKSGAGAHSAGDSTPNLESDCAEHEQGGAGCSPIPLPRLEGWRRGPTDNYYDREYRKLMGAPLPRPVEQLASPSAVLAAETASTPQKSISSGTSPAKGTRGSRQLDDAGETQQLTSCDAGSNGDSISPRKVATGNAISSQHPGPCETNGEEQQDERQSDQGMPGDKLPDTGVVSSGRSCPVPASTVQCSTADGESVDVVNAGPIGVEHTEALALADADGGTALASAAVATAGATKVGGDGRGAKESGWEDGRRRSPICETSQILAALVKQRVKTLAFCRTRKLTELTLRYGRLDLERTAPDLAPLVQGYRGGYTRHERRKIESRLFANQLLGVTATCALELGVDIGALDVTVHLGFPGSVSSLRQQSGRAGRGGTDSLSIMILFQDPISQFFVRNPAELLHKAPEAAVLDANNELVLAAHVLCAAAECPLGMPTLGGVTDAALFGGEERLKEVIDTMTEGDFPRLVQEPRGLGWKANPGLDPPPSRRIGLRMIDPVSFDVVNDMKGGEAFDSVEYSRAFFTLFEGAIYLHQAKQYLVTKLDLGKHVAHTRPVKVNYYTAAHNNVDVNVTKRLEVSEDNHAHTGCVDVVATVYAFAKKQLGTGRTLERGQCSLPPLQYATRAFWMDVGISAKADVERERCDFEGGVHAVGHALLAVVPLFLMCDESDVDCEHARPFYNRPRPQRILIYDKRPGGVGVADAMFGCHRAVLSRALELVQGCPCPEGCLACIHNHRCTGYNAIVDKRAAIIILKVTIRDMMKVEYISVKNVPAKHGGSSTTQCPQSVGNQSDGARRKAAENLGGGFLHDQGARDEDVSAQGDDVGGNEVLISPRKRQRLRNLRLAKGMDKAREKDIAVVGCWIPSVP